MLKTVAAGLTALFVTASSLAHAQAPSATATTGREQENARPSAADLNALTDARIGIVKAALQLIPEQAKYWPAVEEAIPYGQNIHRARFSLLLVIQNQ